MQKVFYFLIAIFLLIGCKQLDTSVQVFNTNNGKWDSKDKPSFTFKITDTESQYEMAFLIRHTNNYRYNNLFVNVAYIANGASGIKEHIELPLTNGQLGWSGKVFNNIVETYVTAKILPDSIFPLRAGEYTFTIENIMREDPLPEILQVGLMLKKH